MGELEELGVSGHTTQSLQAAAEETSQLSVPLSVKPAGLEGAVGEGVLPAVTFGHRSPERKVTVSWPVSTYRAPALWP